jgi:alpha-tubulin suppressor-like RCC1 family protein
MIRTVLRSWLVLSLGLLGGCERLFGLDHVQAAPRDDSGLPDTPPGQCGHRSVATGKHHTCAIDIDGAVWCWGLNDAWQVQAGAADVVLDPVRIDALPAPAVQVAAGRSVSCARLVDGSVWCWGKNENGELGLGTKTERLAPNPVDLAGDKAIDLEVGAFHVCIRRQSDSAVMCWGSNQLKEVGDASATEVTVPTLVAGTEGMQRISIGHRHTCGISSTGAVQCWGKGEDGQLGQGNATTPTLTTANGVAGATAITAGGRSTCAIVAGAARCWGYNEYGQLGNGNYSNAAAPGTTVMTGAVDVALGSAGGCALGDTGLVSCWGILGAGDGTLSSSTLPQPSLVTSASAIAVGFYHVCAIVDGRVQCWGENTYGELGRGTRDVTAVPTTVGGLPALAADVRVGAGHACARLTNGDVYCWGQNNYGQLGVGTHTASYVPVKVTTGLSGIIGIASGYERTCAWNNANAKCWGSNPASVLGTGMASYDEPSPVAVATTGVKAMALGAAFTCAITSASALVCWGSDAVGQLGDNMTVDSPTAKTVAIGSVVQVAAGARHVCARKTDNTLACWGQNDTGQVGNMSTTDAHAPYAVPFPAAVTDVSAGRRSTCAIAGGILYCWGGNDHGQLGLGDTQNRTSPVAMTLPATPIDVELGAYGGCVRLSNATTQCWGAGDRGQLANGETKNHDAPVEVSGLGGAPSLEFNGGCVLQTGAVNCWGTTALLGNGDLASARPDATSLVCPAGP